MTQHQTRPQPKLPDPFRQARPMSRAAVVGIAVLLGVLSAVVTGLVVSGGSSPATTHTVRYDAEADAAAGGGRTGMVTAQTADGGTTQGVGPLPFSDVLDGFRAGDFVYISVQNQQGAGSVTCRITVDGVVVSENTSSGGYTIATCQGDVPR